MACGTRRVGGAAKGGNPDWGGGMMGCWKPGIPLIPLDGIVWNLPGSSRIGPLHGVPVGQQPSSVGQQEVIGACGHMPQQPLSRPRLVRPARTAMRRLFMGGFLGR